MSATADRRWTALSNTSW